MVTIGVNAHKRAGSPEPTTIIKALEEIKGVTGVTDDISFSAASHVLQKGVTIITVTGGKFTLGAEIGPQHVPVPYSPTSSAKTLRSPRFTAP